MPGTVKIVKKKPTKSPVQKMKGLQWNKIPQNKIKGTVFEKFSADYKGSVNIDYKDIEELFAAKQVEKKEFGLCSRILLSPPASRSRGERGQKDGSNS